MADVITWDITNLHRYLDTGAVYGVDWIVYVDRETDKGTLRSSSYGSIGLNPHDPEDFIPYENLEKETVVEWLLNQLGKEQVDAITSSLSGELNAKEKPKTDSGLPW